MSLMRRWWTWLVGPAQPRWLWIVLFLVTAPLVLGVLLPIVALRALIARLDRNGRVPDPARWATAAAIVLVAYLAIGAANPSTVPARANVSASPGLAAVVAPTGTPAGASTPAAPAVTPEPTQNEGAGETIAPPEPSAPPLAVYVPPPTPTPDPRWPAFLAHMQDSTPRGQTLLSTVQADATASDVVSLVVDLVQLRGWAVAEVGWLDDHKPAACYHDEWVAYHRAVTGYRDGAAYWTRWASDFPSGSSADLNTGAQQFSTANAELGQATDELPRVTCP